MKVSPNPCPHCYSQEGEAPAPHCPSFPHLIVKSFVMHLPKPSASTHTNINLRRPINTVFNSIPFKNRTRETNSH